MKRLSLFDKCVLALLGVCLLVMAGRFTLSVWPSGPWWVEVQRRADPMENAQLWREGHQTDGLLEGEIMDLNTASVSDLGRLPGLGAGLARDIVEWREQNGGFACVENLAQIKGIGQVTLEAIRPYVTVGTGN